MRIEIGGLFHRHRVQREGRLGGGFERGVEVQGIALIAAFVHEQRVARFGALDGEIEMIVVGQGIAGIDADLASIPAIGQIGRQKFDCGAAVGGHVDGLGFEHAAIQHQRNAALRRVGVPKPAMVARTRVFPEP